MADSLSSSLGEEKERDKEDRERARRNVKSEKNKDEDGVSDTLGFRGKIGGSKSKKRSLSGKS